MAQEEVHREIDGSVYWYEPSDNRWQVYTVDSDDVMGLGAVASSREDAVRIARELPSIEEHLLEGCTFDIVTVT